MLDARKRQVGWFPTPVLEGPNAPDGMIDGGMGKGETDGQHHSAMHGFVIIYLLAGLEEFRIVIGNPAFTVMPAQNAAVTADQRRVEPNVLGDSGIAMIGIDKR